MQYFSAIDRKNFPAEDFPGNFPRKNFSAIGRKSFPAVEFSGNFPGKRLPAIIRKKYGTYSIIIDLNTHSESIFFSDT